MPCSTAFRRRDRIPVAHPLCVALSLLIAGTCAAADGTAPHHAGDGMVTLDTLVVTDVTPTLAMTFVTDTKLPRQPVPASDGADYLRTVPGFSLIRSGGTNGDPVLRGMFGSRLNLLTDGGHMQGACPARMDNSLSYVSPETYDRLEVIKGPQTVLWGPGASAGTVRFERDIPFFDAPGAQFNGSLTFGSFDRNDQVIDTAFGNADGYARVTANRSEADDYEDGDGRTVPSAWKKWNADVAFGWTPDADSLVEVSTGRGDGAARYAGRGMDGSQFARTTYGLRAERRNLEGAFDKIEARLYYNDVDHVMDNYTLRDPDPDSSMPMPMASNVAQRTQGGRLALAWNTDAWDLNAGLDVRDSLHRKRGAMGRDAYRSQPWTTDARSDNIGVFAELGWNFAPRQRLVGGLRVDRASVQDERASTGGMMPQPNPTHSVTRRETLPSGLIRWEVQPQGSATMWHLGLGHVQRMPDYWELFSPTLGPAGSINAFAGIEPERTTQLDIGMHYREGRWDAWASLYAGRIQDYILFEYAEGTMDSITRATNADADTRGGELGVEFRPNGEWKLGGSLAYAWGDIDGIGAMPQTPPLEARLNAAYDNKRWSLGALLRVAAAQDRVNPGYGNVVGQDLGTTPGFAVFSINGGYRFTKRLQLAAGIDNLFDRTYAEHLNLAGNSAFGYPGEPVRIHEPGRSAWLKLNYRF
jgi:iron complex outermembrane receptor protein